MTSRENPFVPSIEERDPLRRFRGRLAAPVTIVTSGTATQRAGLTVSSLFVVEGEPGQIHLVVGPVTELWDLITETRRCVVHIADVQHRGVADVFAGLRPSPGGPFAGIETTESEWGPVISAMADRAYCRVVSSSEVGWSGIVETEVEAVELSEVGNPLIHHRGHYRGLGDKA